ncbi:MAG: hypothetical protein DWP94_13325 [Flavobacterium sp.]|nr:MAG: hypothetical protein DWP94_13325 [Flavobacterium sp.]
MKTKHFINSLLMIFLLSMFSGISQEKSAQMYWIHEDHVKPSMVGEYEAVSKELVAACKKHSVEDAKWITLASDNFNYIYVGEIDKMGDLDENIFAGLYEKMGKEAFSGLFDRMDKCYSDHVDYIITLDKDLSYQPSGIDQMPEGKYYRNNVRYFVTPENYDKGYEIAKKYKKLFSEKGSKMYYRVYRSGFGAEGTFFMVAIAAESPEAYERMSADNNKLLGEAGAKLNQELMGIISKMDEMQGWMRTDLSYMGN